MYEGDHKNTVSSFKGVYVIGNVLFSDLGPGFLQNANQNTVWTGRVSFPSPPSPHFHGT